jgi:hypothetical protein
VLPPQVVVLEKKCRRNDKFIILLPLSAHSSKLLASHFEVRFVDYDFEKSRMALGHLLQSVSESCQNAPFCADSSQ